MDDRRFHEIMREIQASNASVGRAIDRWSARAVSRETVVAAAVVVVLAVFAALAFA